MHYAVVSGKIEAAKMLVNEYGANAYAKTNDYETFLHLAAKYDKTKTVEWLITEFSTPRTSLIKCQYTKLPQATL